MLENVSSTGRFILGGIFMCGMGMAGGSGLALYFFEFLLGFALQAKMSLSPTSETFPKWQAPPIEIDFSVFLFNVTNPDEVLDGQKIIFAEAGPYVFNVKYFKDVIRWDVQNGEVEYNLHTTFHFNQNKTVGDLSDEVYFFNVPLLAGVASGRVLTETDPSMVDGVVDILADLFQSSGATLIEKRTVDDLLFKGYKSPTMKALIEMASGMGVPLPPVDPDAFGLLKDRNNSIAGPFVAYTGSKDISKFNVLKSFHNMSITETWSTKYCNMINGTDGMMFPPFVTKTSKLQVYSTDLCRSVYLEYASYEEIKGIPSYKFTMGDDVFADPRSYPDNQCYCLQDNALKYDVDKCPRRGIFSLKPCMGLPAFSSNPHFYDCARRHIEQIEGMKPDKTKHQLFIKVNPTTGIVMEANKVAQISIPVEPMGKMTYLENITQALIPLLWIKEVAVWDEPTADEFKAKVMFPINLGLTILITCAGFGGIAVVTVTSIALYFTGMERMRVGGTEILHYKT